MLALVALAACGGDPATAPDKTGVSAAPGTSAHDELPDGVFEEFTVGGQVFCRVGGSPLIGVGHCPSASARVQITYLAGTPLLTDGGETIPLILPDSLIRNAAAIGAPPQFGGGSWPDSLRFDVSVVSNGTALPGRSISLQVSAIDEAGQSMDSAFGHFHHGAGSIAKPTGQLSDETVTTSPNGTATVSFRSSIAGGPVVITATSQGAERKVDTVWVGVPGLVQLVPSALLDTVAPTTIHPSSNWVTPRMHSLLLQLADTFRVRFGKRIGYNDASLRFGGKFDLRQQWNAPSGTCPRPNAGAAARPWGCHKLHRLGRDVDVRTSVLTELELNFLRNRWSRLAGREPAIETDHWHFSYRR